MVKTFYVGIKGVIKVNNSVLIMKKIGQDGKAFWDIPGGRMDDIETISDTLARELKEEVPTIGNYTVATVLNAYRLPRDLNDGNGLFLVYYLIDAEPFEATISDEHLEYKWVKLADLDDLQKDKDTAIQEGYLEAIKLALAVIKTSA